MFKNCSKCLKEIASGKFYNFFIGKKGGKNIQEYDKKEVKGDNFFCPICVDQEKANPQGVYIPEDLIKVEWEIGNLTDEEILNFEKKWRDFNYENSVRINFKETNLTLDFIKKSRQELEPYLNKLNVVEKSFGGKVKKGYGKSLMNFCYLFTKSALDENYRKEVVVPTVAKILGGNSNQEINTTNVGGSPGVPGETKGTWQVDNQLNINYFWNDGPERICRRISFLFCDQKFALESLCWALTNKEKELQEEINDPNDALPINWGIVSIFLFSLLSIILFYKINTKKKFFIKR
ncbi:hypothetical protein [endosymbiont GvMRE of Glomus versiforme]|uniref:hypothetical protein n=1 Tax=endosymbiont GvMRE of Glomus versiforme TaxID=2039283 RepID=UPI000ED3CFF6|nr:hypothetical protein [endosymbiont GvMRE of Glomus versiforme]RHZ35599.1 hypothetical protein GvMRE_IIg306 [endosymbiont GvMRE of Glomus versiforme]